MTFVVAATWVAAPGEEEQIAQALRTVAPPSREEPGNVVYEPHRSPDRPNTFFIYEKYVDEAAFEAHRASAHFRQHVLDDAIDFLASREVEFYTCLEQ